MNGVELAVDFHRVDDGGGLVADEVEVPAKKSEKICLAANDSGSQGRFDAFSVTAN